MADCSVVLFLRSRLPFQNENESVGAAVLWTALVETLQDIAQHRVQACSFRASWFPGGHERPVSALMLLLRSTYGSVGIWRENGHRQLLLPGSGVCVQVSTGGSTRGGCARGREAVLMWL